jgi:hypothetical protein
MAKQIMNVRDVMAVLEVSESKAYGVIERTKPPAMLGRIV